MSAEIDVAQSEIDEFLAERHQAIFATNQIGRPPQLSPVWYLWDGSALYVSTSSHSLKSRNLAVDNRASVCVDGGRGDYRYVAMSGEVEFIPCGSELQRELRYRIIRKYHDSDESARAYFEASASDENVIVVLRPSKLIFKDFN